MSIIYKKSIFLAFALCLANQIFAQSKAEEILTRYRFGLFGGVGYSSLKPTSSKAGTDYIYDVAKNNGKLAIEFGLNIEKGINKRYSFYSGLGLNWMGGSITSTKNVFTGKDSSSYANSAAMKYKLQYLQVPFGLKLKATSIDRFQIYTQLGLDAGILIGRKANYTIDGATNTNEKLGIKTLNPISLGFQAGIGTEFEVTDNNSAFAGILYHNGFLDHTFPLQRGTKPFNDGNVRGNVITVRIGYYF